MIGAMANEHSPHCRTCKERTRELLKALFGHCEVNASFSWSARPAEYRNAKIGEDLQRIRDGLANLRGHRDFIKSPLMPPCDYYVPSQKLIVEFDESQHFTLPRLTALDLYPEDAPLGYSKHAWQELCRRIDAHDDTPIDRDERRAWYDTLRDLLPSIHGFQPTIRLFAEDYAWCGLDPQCQSEREIFLRFLRLDVTNPSS